MFLLLRRNLIFLCAVIYFPSFAQKTPSALSVYDLQCNKQAAPLCIDDLHPRLSWKLRSNGRNIFQSAYEVEVNEKRRKNDLAGWRTGKVVSEVSIGIAYNGPALLSGRLYYWRVRVWDRSGSVSSWSKLDSFRVGLLQARDWVAQWISPDWNDGNRVPPMFMKRITIPARVRTAILYITAHGIYEPEINGARVGAAYFAPGWTSYDRRLTYQAYDVTNKLVAGANSIKVTVGDGWWRGVFGGDMSRNHYGKDAALLFQLAVAYEDGRRELIVSDSSWTCAEGPIRYADFYNGEIYDGRIERGSETAVRVLDNWPDRANLVASSAPGVIQHERFGPTKMLTDPAGNQLIDFGQNISGWVRCRITGQAGDTIRISHAEALDKAGVFYIGNLREAKAQDVYVLKGGGVEVFEPHFTYHGFRYIKVEGVRGPLKAGDFTAVAVYSDLAKTGSFDCSNALLNTLQHNIVWSQQDNFVDIPTDCPQRSERYGWTGDAQIFARTASYNRDVFTFFDKWLKDLASDQDSLGGLPVIVPDLYGHENRAPKRAVAGWGDAATIVPWTLFQAYGDTAILRSQYPSMRAWVEQINRLSPEHFWVGGGYGDWLAPDTVVLTPLSFIAQCYFAHSTELLMRTAGVLGLTNDSVHYAALLGQIRAVFSKVYSPLPATQTACVLALSFGLLPDSLRASVAQQLVGLVHSHGDHLSTGFLGTPSLLPTLTEIGQSDLAYRVLLQEGPPGWLYPITKGATTIWEKWDAIAPDGTVGEKSLNHYSYGAVGDWLYRQVAGICEAAPGYKRIRIEPHPGGGLMWVKAAYESPYGRIVSSWRIKGGQFYLHVEIPVNTEAEILVPDKGVVTVGSGSYDF